MRYITILLLFLTQGCTKTYDILKDNSPIIVKEKSNVKVMGSKTCWGFDYCCDDANHYKIHVKGKEGEVLFKSRLLLFKEGIFIPKPSGEGSFSFKFWACQPCKGVTYFELRSEEDSLLVSKKFTYYGQYGDERNGDNGKSENFDFSHIQFNQEKMKIFNLYEYDTLTLKRTLITPIIVVDGNKVKSTRVPSLLRLVRKNKSKKYKLRGK